MSDFFQERYSPYPLAVNSTTTFPQGTPHGISGFLCVSTGTITITKLSGTVIINAFPCTAGAYYPMPFYLGSAFTVTLAGGASGVLGAD